MEFCVPTLNRPQMIQQLIESVDGACSLRVSYETEPHSYTGIMNRLFRQSYDAGADIIGWFGDHLLVQPGCIDAIQRIFDERFTDLDGCVGLNIANMEPLAGCREYCFIAMGRKFMERFPDINPMCPDYYHFFEDTEIGEYALSIGKFVFGEDAHVHTIMHGGDESVALKDATHKVSRRHVPYDEWCRKERLKRGYLWGKNFNLIFEHDDDIVNGWRKPL